MRADDDSQREVIIDPTTLMQEQLYTYRLIRIVCKTLIFLFLLPIFVSLFFVVAAILLAPFLPMSVHGVCLGFLALLIGIPVTIMVYKRIDNAARVSPARDASKLPVTERSMTQNSGHRKL